MSEQDRDQQTEAPTAQRIRKAFEEGQVGASSELNSSMVLAVGVLFFCFAGTWFFESVTDTIRIRSTVFRPLIENPDAIQTVIRRDFSRVAIRALAFLIPLSLIAIASGGLQSNFNLSFKQLELKWDKLSVIKGFKRIFSSRSVVKGLLAVAKTAAIVLLATIVTQSQFENLTFSGSFSFKHMIAVLCHNLIYISVAVAMLVVILGVIDLGFQKWKHLQDLKMSHRDIRDEHKESEGDPLIRARVKRLQSELSRQRMIKDVEDATVVVTNPTHFAVALAYDKSSMIAPRVISKGADLLAKEIIKIAKEKKIPVVQRKPVARFLYFHTKIGQTIPAELYQAVAEIMNYINKIDQSLRPTRNR